MSCRKGDCSKSINNGDERELGLDVMLSGPRGKRALRPPTTPFPILQLNLARQQCLAIYNEGVINCYATVSLLLPLYFIELYTAVERDQKN